mgnify:FL=1
MPGLVVTTFSPVLSSGGSERMAQRDAERNPDRRVHHPGIVGTVTLCGYGEGYQVRSTRRSVDCTQCRSLRDQVAAYPQQKLKKPVKSARAFVESQNTEDEDDDDDCADDDYADDANVSVCVHGIGVLFCGPCKERFGMERE